MPGCAKGGFRGGIVLASRCTKGLERLSYAASCCPLTFVETFDPHHVLGLVQPVSAAQVRQAFRRLAMRWHPDRNPSPEAAERFRQIRAAYDALLLEGEEVGSEAEVTRGPVEEGELWVSLEEAILGARKAFTVRRERPCNECGGSGEVDLRYSRLCAPCHGTGRLRGKEGLELCTLCGGRGYRFKAACESCEGRGRLGAERELEVAVPPLCAEGRVLRLAGQGPGPAEGPGDLLLVVRYAAHSLFRREGDRLHLTVPISAVAWLAGQALEVPVPGGQAEVPIPVGGMERRFTLPDLGLPRAAGGRGELVIDLEPQMPLALDPGALKLLRQLDRRLAADEGRHFPEVAAWRQRVLSAAVGS
jgi:molecular chaperone DnaJ